jgi:hypothetical protein
MPLFHVSLDLDAHFRLQESLSPRWPADRDAFEAAARKRARFVFERFEKSPEARPIEDQPRWPILVMREACRRHRVTIDDLTPEIFEQVSCVFIEQDDVASFGFWTEVVQSELVAFFRFLAREGFVHAAGCLAVLERIGPERLARFEALSAATATEIDEEQAARLKTTLQLISIAPGCAELPECARPRKPS